MGAAFLVYGFSALGEELIYRGYLLNRWHAWRGSWGEAVFVSSLIFGAMHLHQGPSGIVQNTVVGLVLGLFFLLSGSLWVVTIAHWLSNMMIELS